MKKLNWSITSFILASLMIVAQVQAQDPSQVSVDPRIQASGQIQTQAQLTTAVNGYPFEGTHPSIWNPNGWNPNGVNLGGGGFGYQHTYGYGHYGCFPMAQGPYYPGYNPYYQNLYYPYSTAPYYSNHTAYYDYRYYHPYYSNLLYQPYDPCQRGPYGQRDGMWAPGVYDLSRNNYQLQRDYYNNPYYAPVSGAAATQTMTTGVGAQQANGTSVSVVQ